MEVKRPNKVNKYHLKSCKKRSQKLNKSKLQVNKKREDIKLFVICSKIPHTHIPYHVATSQWNRDRSQITGFPNTRDNRAGILRTDFSDKHQ